MTSEIDNSAARQGSLAVIAMHKLARIAMTVRALQIATVASGIHRCGLQQRRPVDRRLRRKRRKRLWWKRRQRRHWWHSGADRGKHCFRRNK